MGAMGAALVSMVCNVSIGKKACEADEQELSAVRTQSETLRRRLSAMVAEDVAAFGSLMAAYKLPKDSDSDKSRRADAIQAALRRATEVPLDCARVCGRVVELARRAGELGFSGRDQRCRCWRCWPPIPRPAARRSMCSSTRPRSRTGDFAQTSVAEIDKLLAWCALESESVYALVRKRLEG